MPRENVKMWFNRDIMNPIEINILKLMRATLGEVELTDAVQHRISQRLNAKRQVAAMQAFSEQLPLFPEIGLPEKHESAIEAELGRVDELRNHNVYSDNIDEYQISANFSYRVAIRRNCFIRLMNLSTLLRSLYNCLSKSISVVRFCFGRLPSTRREE